MTSRRTAPVFCVGLPKCGTHSIVDMLSGACRADHEPESEPLLPLLTAVRSSQLPVGALRSFFLDRDARLQLDFEANHLLGSFIPHLLDAFPRARFVLLVRDCRQWIDSMINDQLNLRVWDGYQRWQVVYDQYLGGEQKRFTSQENVLRELDLYPLHHYVRYWREEPEAIVRRLASRDLLLLRTEELTMSVRVIADFVGVSATTVAADRSHSYRASRKHEVLAALDPGYVDRVIGAQSRSQAIV